MKTPNINYGSSEWRDITKALAQVILEIDVANRDVHLDAKETLRNRVRQEVIQEIIGWGRDTTPKAGLPVYAVPIGDSI